MRLAQYLADHHVAFETIPHPPAFTASRRARVLHVPGRQVAKCVLLHGPEGYVVAVLPATHQVDLDAAAKALGGPVRLASAAEVADRFLGCEWGALAPFGRLYDVPTVVDVSLGPDAVIVFEAESHFRAIRMHYRDFARLEEPRRLRLARPAS